MNDETTDEAVEERPMDDADGQRAARVADASSDDHLREDRARELDRLRRDDPDNPRVDHIASILGEKPKAKAERAARGSKAGAENRAG